VALGSDANDKLTVNGVVQNSVLFEAGAGAGRLTLAVADVGATSRTLTIPTVASDSNFVTTGDS
jgi:hypothetical protein